MSKLRKDAFESPFYHVAVIVLAVLGVALLTAELLKKREKGNK